MRAWAAPSSGRRWGDSRRAHVPCSAMLAMPWQAPRPPRMRAHTTHGADLRGEARPDAAGERHRALLGVGHVLGRLGEVGDVGQRDAPLEGGRPEEDLRRRPAAGGRRRRLRKGGSCSRAAPGLSARRCRHSGYAQAGPFRPSPLSDEGHRTQTARHAGQAAPGGAAWGRGLPSSPAAVAVVAAHRLGPSRVVDKR